MACLVFGSRHGYQAAGGAGGSHPAFVMRPMDLDGGLAGAVPGSNARSEQLSFKSQVHLQYFERCQNDAVTGRHSDMGSSCCALFASAVVAGANADSQRLTEVRLEALLVQCVLTWDAAREVAGCEPVQVL